VRRVTYAHQKYGNILSGAAENIGFEKNDHKKETAAIKYEPPGVPTGNRSYPLKQDSPSTVKENQTMDPVAQEQLEIADVQVPRLLHLFAEMFC
jgi:hypothetical protein